MGACADTASEITSLTRGLASPRAHWPDAASRHLDGVLSCRRGALSIVVLGGSMTEGQLAGGRCPPCVADTARRWSAVLERLLRGLLPSCRVAVHNRAARATTTEHVLHHAATIFSGDAAAPDLVLVDYALNDYSTSTALPARERRHTRNCRPPSRRPSGCCAACRPGPPSLTSRASTRLSARCFARSRRGRSRSTSRWPCITTCPSSRLAMRCAPPAAATITGTRVATWCTLRRRRTACWPPSSPARCCPGRRAPLPG